ncbi:MAG: hypothetical protein ACOYNF_04385 [Rhodoferax sp.]
MRTFVVLLLALLGSLMARAATSAVMVEVDAAQVNGVVRDVFGANRKPTAAASTPGINWNAASLYTAFGITQVRLHDSNVDLCTTYTAATKRNTGVSPAQSVQGCSLQGSGARPQFNWTPISSADADLNNPDNYDFTAADEALLGAIATGAQIYLRLGESYNGPNDTNDPVAWAKIATNIYRHVLGDFKPTAGIAVNPVFVEIFNEPDGGFWAGTTATFNTLFVETAQRVRAAAAAAGRSVKVGGAGFTKNVLAKSTELDNPANGFIAAVGATNIDFFSAHLYDKCSTATLTSSATFLRALRDMVNAQGGSAKPLQITEWNIGLGSQCGNAFYAEPRTQSFDSGILTLMQDPAYNIEAAHFYAAMPIMALFDFTSVVGTVRINPSAWSLWAHSRLRGANMLATQVCPQGAACVAGYAAESTPLMALSAQVGTGQSMVITNDSATAVNYMLRVKGLSASAVTATISTPPSEAQDLPASGSPVVTDATALAMLLGSVPKVTQAGLAVSSGAVDIPLTIPAYSLQMVELESVLAPVLTFATGWNLVGNSVEQSIAVATLFNDATKVNAIWKWVSAGTMPGISYPTWAFYTPAQFDGGQAYAASKGYEALTTIGASEGFWVQTSQAFSITPAAGTAVQSASFKPATVNPVAVGGSRALPPGWSLIATGDSPTPAQFNAALTAAASSSPGHVPNNLNTLWAWDASRQNWYFWSPSLYKSGGLTGYLASHNYLDFVTLPTTPTGTLAPASGFWVHLPYETLTTDVDVRPRVHHELLGAGVHRLGEQRAAHPVVDLLQCSTEIR